MPRLGTEGTFCRTQAESFMRLDCRRPQRLELGCFSGVPLTFDLQYESVQLFRLPFSAAVCSFSSYIVSFIRHDCAVQRGPIRLCAMSAVDGSD